MGFQKGVRFLRGAKIFLYYPVPIGCGSHAAFCSMAAGGYSPGIKWTEREANHSPTFTAEVKSERNILMLLLKFCKYFSHFIHISVIQIIIHSIRTYFSHFLLLQSSGTYLSHYVRPTVVLHIIQSFGTQFSHCVHTSDILQRITKQFSCRISSKQRDSVQIAAPCGRLSSLINILIMPLILANNQRRLQALCAGLLQQHIGDTCPILRSPHPNNCASTADRQTCAYNIMYPPQLVHTQIYVHSLISSDEHDPNNQRTDRHTLRNMQTD